ncbi:tyrosine-type recombinase/integrase [Paenibacillus sp. FSL K6-3166]|uniref:tyrosine-type recombinase/integrase n=1 Tax=Bacillales TaxID=1385 RepID=UPI000BA01852|nr:tyrosine-type recombinase/integrase [Paenibacillus sp. VTT E-133291]MBY3621261.1 tyrosine-type recombinase/integrase [Acinetobacter sp. CUI P1]OZQ81542.1 hypothetical protein CA598_26430 [Paenibacillus sp. VTT E-133291]
MSQIIAKSDNYDDIEEYSDDEFITNQSIEIAKEIIVELKINHVLINGEFDEDNWTLVDNKEINIQKYFTFNDITDSVIKIKVKCWILNYLLKIKPSSGAIYLHNLKEFLTITNNLLLQDIEEIEFSLNNLDSSIRHPILLSGVNFIDYIYSSRNADSYIELFLNQLRLLSAKFTRSYNTRDLPPFKDIIRFSYILTSYARIWDAKHELKFSPVLIWWKLTSIIPMRPSEFCSIKRNCLSVKGNSYYITLPRQKQKATTKTFEVIDTLPISQEIYNLIQRYLIISEPFGETSTLISASVYRSTMIQFPSQVRKRKFNPNYFVLYMLNNLLNSFYNEVINATFSLEPIKKINWIKKKYNKKMNIDQELNEFITDKQIIKIQPNDTRHYAICSMMIQGFNPLTIARMAGHQHLESQYHYQKHIEFFIDSNAYGTIIENRLINKNDTGSFDSTLAIKDIVLKSLAPEELFDFKDEVEIGFCTDKLKRCESRICLLCSKNWIPREEIEKNLKEIIELKTGLKKKLKNRSDTLKRIYKDIKVEYKNCRISPIDLEELARESKLTIGDIHDYATLITNIFKEKE